MNCEIQKCEKGRFPLQFKSLDVIVVVKMLRFALVAFYVTATLARMPTKRSSLEKGMTMSSRAYDAVCWYENLKQFPNTNTKQYGLCSSKAAQLEKQILYPSKQNQKYFLRYPDSITEMYADGMANIPISKIPKEYKSACEKYLWDPYAKPSTNESLVLLDLGADYPFKAFSYCLMQTLRKKHGNKAIEAVKNERTFNLKNWMQTLLDRENEFRRRHGAEPLKIVKPLYNAAQKWAELNAKECNLHHSELDDPRAQWRGEGTGESLTAGGGEDNKRVAAYIAADGWYEEIKDYPYPEYKGDGTDALFDKIGHFTQSVWKASKYVGYGYAYNPNCSPYNFYIAARYFPAGNVLTTFGKNVAPPQY